MLAELAFVLIWTSIYAATGALIANSDCEAVGDDFFLWSGSYGVIGAGANSLLVLFSMSH